MLFRSHVDAINMLSNPDCFDQVHKRMQTGAELAYLQMMHDAAQEKIKAGLEKPDEHFIIHTNGQYGVFDPSGKVVGIYDSIDDAREAKGQLDAALLSPDELNELMEIKSRI